MRTLVLCLLRPTTRVPAYVPGVGDGSPAPRQTGMCRGEARASQGTGPSSSCVPWSNTPPDTTPSSPKTSCRGLLVPSGKTGPSASGKTRGFGAAVPWPTHSHAYASLTLFPRSAQGWLPARAGSPLAGRDVHPLDDARRFMVASHPPMPFDPQGLVALKILSAGSSALSASWCAPWAWPSWSRSSPRLRGVEQYDLVVVDGVPTIALGDCTPPAVRLVRRVSQDGVLLKCLTLSSLALNF
jgi:hypothetical protein